MTVAIPKPSSLPELPTDESIPVDQPEEKLPTAEEVILNHEQRIQALEAALMRIRGAI